jgi:hypothetical protein
MNRAEMAVAFGAGEASPQGGCWGNWTPDGILQWEGEANFLLVLGAHEAHPKTTLYGVVFEKFEWAPAYVGTAIAAWVESGVITATWWRTRSASCQSHSSVLD